MDNLGKVTTVPSGGISVNSSKETIDIIILDNDDNVEDVETTTINNDEYVMLQIEKYQLLVCARDVDLAEPDSDVTGTPVVGKLLTVVWCGAHKQLNSDCRSLARIEEVFAKRNVAEKTKTATAMEGGGQNLSELYSSSKRLSLKIRDALERLERFEFTSTSSSSLSSSSAVVAASSDDQPTLIRRDINQIQSLCADMDRLWRSIPSKPQRDLWKRKVEQVSEEAESFRSSLDKYTSRNQKRIQEAQERAELLGRASGDTVLRIFDEESQAMESVRRSSRLLEESFATGVAVLSKYSEQRDHLKRAQRKALDVLNTLGLSNSLLRLIERRNRFDKWIKYAGMILTIFIVVMFWRWTR
ncbi:membrin 11 [Perilla frutescens var. hirtella]|nr:membrin 11 [Perilla frutescens var. hirtella]